MIHAEPSGVDRNLMKCFVHRIRGVGQRGSYVARAYLLSVVGGVSFEICLASKAHALSWVLGWFGLKLVLSPALAGNSRNVVRAVDVH